jgi:hypothetical protein
MKTPKPGAKRQPASTTPKIRRAPVGGGGSRSGSLVSAADAGPFATARLITNTVVLNILKNGLGPLIPPAEFPIRTILADNAYLETPPEFVLNAITTDPILSPESYHADIFDCDDYVQYLKTKLSLFAASNRLQAPLAVGYVFTTEHAFTVCIGGESQLFLINTQSTDHAVTGNPTLFRQFLALRSGNSITAIYL